MTGVVTIDGHNVLTEFGIIITESSYASIMSYPPLKAPDTVDWAERNGIEVDLSQPVLDTKEVDINFVALSTANVAGFIQLLRNTVYHACVFSDLSLTKNLRLVSNSNYTGTLFSQTQFVLKFADDFPLQSYTYSPASSTLVSAQGYTLDSVDLSSYGIAVLLGSDAEILKIPDVKLRQNYGNKFTAGLKYDDAVITGDDVLVSAKDVTLKLLMKATSISNFWLNYNAFLYNLTKPNKRTFGASFNSSSNYCYYKNSKMTEFLSDDVWNRFDWTLMTDVFIPDVWVKFDLTLVFIGTV